MVKCASCTLLLVLVLLLLPPPYHSPPPADATQQWHAPAECPPAKRSSGRSRTPHGVLDDCPGICFGAGPRIGGCGPLRHPSPGAGGIRLQQISAGRPGIPAGTRPGPPPPPGPPTPAPPQPHPTLPATLNPHPARHPSPPPVPQPQPPPHRQWQLSLKDCARAALLQHCGSVKASMRVRGAFSAAEVFERWHALQLSRQHGGGVLPSSRQALPMESLPAKRNSSHSEENLHSYRKSLSSLHYLAAGLVAALVAACFLSYFCSIVILMPFVCCLGAA